MLHVSRHTLIIITAVESSGESGSGGGGGLMAPDTPTPSDNTAQASEWLESIQLWGSDLSQWRSFVDLNSGLDLPDSIASYIAMLNDGVRAAEVRENSGNWSVILTGWGENYESYTSSFSEMCPKTY